MRIDIATSHLTENEQQQTVFALSNDESQELHVIQIEPEDAFETVLQARHLLSGPIIFLLPEQSLAFSQPEHFAQLQQVCTPNNAVGFVFPENRISALAHSAHHTGFPFAPSLEKAVQLLSAHEEEQDRGFLEVVASPIPQKDDAVQDTSTDEVVVEEKQDDLDEQEGDERQSARSGWPRLPITPYPESFSLPFSRASRKQSGVRRRGLLAAQVALVVVTSAVLLPVLFSQLPELMNVSPLSAAQAISVGQIAFTSSGQLDPANSRGLNDTVMLSLHNLSMPVSGKSDYVWLLPDKSDEKTRPLLLGKLSITAGKAQLTYVHPDHENLLASLSRFLVTEQESERQPVTPSLDPVPGALLEVSLTFQLSEMKCTSHFWITCAIC